MSELLPINPSLYNPALQYSDQYMDLAMVPPIVNQLKQNTDDIEELKEGGGGGGSQIYIIGGSVNESTGDITLDKTGQEILTAMASNMLCYVMITEGDSSAGLYNAIYLGGAGWDENGAGFYGYDCFNARVQIFACASLSDYPATTNE